MDSPVDDLTLPLPEPSRRSRRLPIALLVIGCTLMATLGYLAMRGQPHAALPEGATELVATLEGIVGKIHVAEGQEVVEGDLLLSFDDQAEQDELANAHAALQELASEVQASDVAVAITPPEGVTGRIVPIGPIWDNAPRRVDPLPAPEPGATPLLPPVQPEAGPKPNPKRELEEAVTATESQLNEAKGHILNVQHQLETARSEALDAQKNAEASKVMALQRKQHVDKMRMLLNEGAVSQLETAKAEAQYASIQGAYLVAQENANDLARKVKDLEGDLARTEAAIPQLEKLLDIQRTALKNTPEPKVALPESPPLREVETRPLPKPAIVQPTPLPSEPTKVEVDKGAIREADQLLAGAKERVDKAEAALIARRILAPRKGKVLKLLVKPGERVKRGQVIAILL